MTEQQQAAYVQAQASAALIAAMAMFQENAQRLQKGESLVYDEVQFYNLIADHGIDHNAVMTLFHGR